jgi:mono/diheme cytochrome c family protein
LADIFVASAGAVLAQTSLPPEQLNDTQKAGQKLFYQSCGVCHLKPQITAPLYGPALSRESASGNEAAIKTIIAEGIQRMPGFKHQFNEQQIAQLASYVLALPPSPPAPPAQPR